MDDELQEVRDNFFCGNLQKALQLCESTKSSNDITQSECDATLARACLSLGLFDRLKAMQNSECPGQKAAAMMAILTKSKNETQRTAAKDRLVTLAKETQDMSCSALAANAMAFAGDWNDACQMAQNHPTLEMQALRVFILLLCNNANMAEKQLHEMAGNNDDSSSFRMAQAAVHLATGNPEEAYLTYCDLSTQFPAVDGDDGSGSVLLQTGKGVANMQRGMYTEAVEDLVRANTAAPNDPDVLVNLCCCMTHLKKKEEFGTYYAKLEAVCPAHPYVVKTQGITTAFTRFKASMSA